MSDIQSIDNQYIASTYGRFPVTLVSGNGCYGYDEDGNEYIDMGSGIGVNLFGYCDPVWKAAVISQLDSIQHASNLYYTAPGARLAEQLCTRTGMKKVFFCNSGAEANECAIKAARRYGQLHKGDECYWIITLENSFHGRTLTTLAATGQDKFHQLFQPLTSGFLHARANHIEDVRTLVSQYPVAAVMMEFVQGEGGVNVLEPSFVSEIKQLAEENDILIIDDEVQTGNGRTGALYAYMHYDLVPDILTTAKGLGGGLPIGATMLGEKVKDIFHPGDNGSTFGANPAVCAGALSNLNRIDDALLAQINQKSKLIFETMQGADNVKNVTGKGLMIGIEPENGTAAAIAGTCLKHGVLVLTAGGNKVRLLPPLNIPMEALSRALTVIREAFAQNKG